MTKWVQEAIREHWRRCRLLQRYFKTLEGLVDDKIIIAESKAYDVYGVHFM